jgi:putative transposase
MNVKETAVANAANLSLFMVNVAHWLLTEFCQHNAHCGVLDLKAYFRGHKYVTETLKLLPEMPEPVLLSRIYTQVATLGSVYATIPALDSS